MTRTMENPGVMPGLAGLKVSHRAFEELCSENPELRMELTATGELEIMSPASSDTGGRNALLTARLVNWADATRLGRVFDSSAGFILPNKAVRSPDCSWISSERWDALPSRRKKKGFAPICPDFIVELRSPSDTLKELREKMREYIREGVRLGWLIDPKTASVTIYRAGQKPENLAEPLSLSGEDVLPGFVLDLKGILFD